MYYGSATPTSEPSSPWNDYTQSFGAGFMAAGQISSSAGVTADWILNTSAQWGTVALILSPGVPSVPSLISPANAGYADVSSGLAFEGGYNAAGGDDQNAYAMRIKVSGGSYNYWNAGTNALQSGIVWNSDSVIPGGTFGPTLPNTAISNGNVYNWSLASQDATSGLQGPFATDSTFTAQAGPTVTVTAPTGTLTDTGQPAIQWTPSPASGASQISYQIVVESGTYGTTPGSGTQQWVSGIVASTATSVAIGTPLMSGTYRAFVQIAETGGQTSSWAYTTFTLVVDTPGVPIVTATASTDTNGCPIITVAVQGLDNYLTANDSSFEGGGTGSVGTWTAGASSAIAASETEAKDGTWSLRFTCSSGSGTVLASSAKYAAVAGTAYTFMGSVRAGATARSCSLQASWYNGATLLSTSTLQTANDSSGAWTALSGTATAPASTTEVVVTLSIASVASTTEYHYLDQVGLFPSGATAWVVGGWAGPANGALTSTIITRSDGLQVRNASLANPLAIPSVGQLVTIDDYEAGVTYTYSAVVQVASAPLTGTNGTSGNVTLTTTGWWVFDPTAPSGAVTVTVTALEVVQIEQSAVHIPIGQSDETTFPTVMSSGFTGLDGTATIQAFSAATYASVIALALSAKTLLLTSPFGDLFYIRLGPQPGGMSSGISNKVRDTTMLASTPAHPMRTMALSWIAQPRPAV